MTIIPNAATRFASAEVSILGTDVAQVPLRTPPEFGGLVVDEHGHATALIRWGVLQLAVDDITLLHEFWLTVRTAYAQMSHAMPGQVNGHKQPADGGETFTVKPVRTPEDRERYYQQMSDSEISLMVACLPQFYPAVFDHLAGVVDRIRANTTALREAGKAAPAPAQPKTDGSETV